MKISTPYFVLLIAFLSISPNVLLAQKIPILGWQKCYGGSDVDGFNPLNTHMIIQTSDGGYAFIAQTRSDDEDVSGNHKNGIGNVEDDFWLVKINSSGNIQWQKCFGGSATETPECIIQTHDGGFVFCGNTDSQDGDVTGNHPGSQFGPDDAWVVKTDSNGILEWEQCIGANSGDESLNSIIETNDGFMAVGISGSHEEGWFNHSNNSGDDALVVKLNPKGVVMWHKLMGGTYGEWVNCVIPAGNETYIFTGATNSNDGDVSGLHGTASQTDIWTVKFDSAGMIVWQKCYGGSGDDYGNCIIGTQTGYLIAGITGSNNGDVSGNHGKTDGWIVNIDSNGNIINQHCYGGSEFDYFSSVIQTTDSNFVFAGYSYSFDGDASGLHKGVIDSSDGWVGEFSSDWKLHWQKCLGGTGDDGFYSVIQTTDNGFMLNGKTESNNGDISGNHGLSDIWNVKLNSPLNSIESRSGQPALANPYPNPSVSEVNLELYRTSPVSRVEFYDLLGTQVFPDYHIEGTFATIDVHTLPAGIYVIKVSFMNSDVQEIRKFMHVKEF